MTSSVVEYCKQILEHITYKEWKRYRTLHFRLLSFHFKQNVKMANFHCNYNYSVINEKGGKPPPPTHTQFLFSIQKLFTYSYATPFVIYIKCIIKNLEDWRKQKLVMLGKCIDFAAIPTLLNL